MPALKASEVLEREFLELRADLLQAAARLDRLDRADGSLADDPRIPALHRAIEVLAGPDPERSERIQLIFSRPYEEDWKWKLELENGRVVEQSSAKRT